MPCRIVMRCLNLVRILHLTLHNYVPYWLRDAFPIDVLLVITGNIRVLKNETEW